jgi:hypothetical protein
MRGSRCALMSLPRRWERGGPEAATLNRSRGLRSGYLTWSVDRPSKRQVPGKPEGNGGPDATKPVCESGLGRWTDLPSAQVRAETAEQGVLAPAKFRSQVTGRSPNALLLLPKPRAVRRCEVKGAGSSGSDTRGSGPMGRAMNSTDKHWRHASDPQAGPDPGRGIAPARGSRGDRGQRGRRRQARDKAREGVTRSSARSAA